MIYNLLLKLILRAKRVPSDMQCFILKLYIVLYVQKRLKIDFQDSVVIDQKLKTVLEKLLEPAPEDRFQVHSFFTPYRRCISVDMHICFISSSII